MCANADRDVRLEDIATEAGITPRGLQAAFRRELGVTPMTYLRHLRLEAVHRELRAARPGDRHTVGEVARRWGFTNVGRMAAEYRELYGTAPSTTLRFLTHDDGVGARTIGSDEVARRRPRRFRLVLDCEVDVDDPSALRRSVEDGFGGASGEGAWAGYQPEGTTEDLVALTLGRAVRRAVRDVDGVALRAVNPMLRLPDDQGQYPPAELPAWVVSTDVADEVTLEASAVESGDVPGGRQ